VTLVFLWFIGVNPQQFGCQQREVQRKPPRWITDIAPYEIANPPQSVRERVAVDPEPMRGVRK